MVNGECIWIKRKKITPHITYLRLSRPPFPLCSIHSFMPHSFISCNIPFLLLYRRQNETKKVSLDAWNNNHVKKNFCIPPNYFCQFSSSQFFSPRATQKIKTRYQKVSVIEWNEKEKGGITICLIPPHHFHTPLNSFPQMQHKKQRWKWDKKVSLNEWNKKEKGGITSLMPPPNSPTPHFYPTLSKAAWWFLLQHSQFQLPLPPITNLSGSSFSSSIHDPSHWSFSSSILILIVKVNIKVTVRVRVLKYCCKNVIKK